MLHATHHCLQRATPLSGLSADPRQPTSHMFWYCVLCLCSILALVPPWVRIYRIQRDIPMPLVTSGVEKGNLRQLALARMGALGLRCR